ncbi:replication initiator [Janibacter terrae]|uniref:replication initiator n=1 Tax=Janibacter terrae TaxID=103817 RepID=UPI00083120CB|nr:replication initiator [Janibacter terrae]
MHTTTASPSPDLARGDHFPGYGEDTPLDLPALARPQSAQLIASRMRDGTMDAFFDALAATGNCAHPVRLAGSSLTVDTTTGQVISTFDTRDLPFGVLHRPCGNRRASICPSCSRVYARDTYALIHAGINGGKTVPDQVRDNPLLFVTLTAPSFGPVHGHRHGRPCRPRRPQARTRCPHGQPTWCTRTHDEQDEVTGSPLCNECHDTASAVMWQWHAPELWRRFTIALRRG